MNRSVYRGTYSLLDDIKCGCLAEGQGFKTWIDYKPMLAIKLKAPSTELKEIRFRPRIGGGKIVAAKNEKFRRTFIVVK